MLSIENARQLLSMSQRANTFFKSINSKNFEKKIVDCPLTALQAIIEGDHRLLAKIIDEHPKLIFLATEVRDIDGTLITTSPLMYAAEKLDTLALRYFWEKCKDCPKDRTTFIDTLSFTTKVFNPKSLYDAYEHFIKLGKDYNKEHVDKGREIDPQNEALVGQFNALMKSWLNLGMHQRTSLPRHLLQDFCFCLPYDVICNDIMLMRVHVFPVEDSEDKLKNVLKNNENCPLMLYDGKNYYLTYLGMDNKLIFGKNNDESKPVVHVFSKEALPFKELRFPEEMWVPVIKPAEKTDANIKRDKYHRLEFFEPKMRLCATSLSYPLNTNSLYYHIDFSSQSESIMQLFPLSENAGLGYDFALARGFCEISLGLNDPRGCCNFLWAKAQEDFEKIQALIELRTREKNELIETWKLTEQQSVVLTTYNRP